MSFLSLPVVVACGVLGIVLLGCGTVTLQRAEDDRRMQRLGVLGVALGITLVLAFVVMSVIYAQPPPKAPPPPPPSPVTKAP